MRRDHDGALAQVASAIEADAPWLPSWAPMLGDAYRGAGRDQEALEAFLGGLSEEDRTLARTGYTEGGWLEMFRVVTHSRQQRGEICGSGSAWLYAALGDADQMYECMDLVSRGSIVDLFWTRAAFDPYRDDPRFDAQLDRWNIVGYKTCCPFSVNGVEP